MNNILIIFFDSRETDVIDLGSETFFLGNGRLKLTMKIFEQRLHTNPIRPLDEFCHYNINMISKNNFFVRKSKFIYRFSLKLFLNTVSV